MPLVDPQVAVAKVVPNGAGTLIGPGDQAVLSGMIVSTWAPFRSGGTWALLPPTNSRLAARGCPELRGI